MKQPLAAKVDASGSGNQVGAIAIDEVRRRFLKIRDPFGNLIVIHEEPKK